MLPGLILPNKYLRGRFVTDFREYASGANPSDWTAVAGTGATYNVASNPVSVGGRDIAIVSGSTTGHLYWNRIGTSVTDGEILAIVGIGASSVGACGVMARANPASFVGYQVTVNGGFWALAKAEIAYLATSTVAWNNNQRYYIRFRLQGTSLKVKIWQYGTPEPSSWDINTTDATYASGTVSFSSGVASASINAEFFSFVPGNRTAPGLSG